jgi:Poly(ADP-ribose) polymerase catalytic domain
MAIISLLDRDGSSALDIADALSALGSATEEGGNACLHVIDFAQNKSIEVAEVVLAGWLQAPSLTVLDQKALEAVAVILDIRHGRNRNWSEAGLELVRGYLDAEYAEIYAEAQRLEEMRFLLKSIDPHGTSQLLASIGIEESSAVDDALATLPPELISVVERLDDLSVEMLFPLTHLTQLQRLRFGLDNAQSLYLHFVLAEDPAFCLHLDIEKKGKRRIGHATSVHNPWQVIPHGEEPDLPICHGPTSPAKYHLSRVISRHLIGGFKSLATVHVLVTAALQDLGKGCVTCGRDHGVKVRGPTTCSKSVCRNAFLSASLEIHLCQIRQDPAAVDCLLSMVFAAASTGNMQLLPNCPFNNTGTVLQILSLLPSMSSLQNSNGMAEVIQGYNPQVEQLLIWVCTAYRGFFSSAQGNLRIPSLPAGTHQFLLANHSPEHEAAFSKHLSGWHGFGQTRVLFHGTSLDRLFAITCQGLQVMSHTPLQAHGAAAGSGVYCAEEPSTSWSFSGGHGVGNWTQSQFSNFRVLLGLENVGPSVGSGGVHVVRDATTLAVRYLFMIPANSVTVPLAAHITPAMSSVYASLRSGAL